MFTYLFDGFLLRVFSLLQADRLYIIYSSGWKVWVLVVQDTFRLPLMIFSGSFNISYHFNYCSTNPGFDASPEVWHEIRPICSRWPLFRNWFSFTLFPLTEQRCHFCLRVLANPFASTFLLPLSGDSLGPLSLSPGHRVQPSVGFHSDPHSLLSPTGREELTYITISLFSAQ